MKSFVFAAALALSFLAARGVAQPASQLLQRGIYNQETSGDLDAAIQIYRQIVGSAQDRTIAAQAQFRLTETLLSKGDLAAAGEEFGKLARDFADSPNLVKTMAARVRALGENGVPQLLGSFQNGRYHHNLTGTEMTVSSDWSFHGQSSRPDGGDRMDFADSSGRASAFLWVKHESIPATNIAVGNTAASLRGLLHTAAGRTAILEGNALQAANLESAPAPTITERLRQRLDRKLAQQRQDSDAMHGFRLRPESIQSKLVGGHQALYAVGDYVERQAFMPGKLGTPLEVSENMSEYQVFIQTEKIAIFFSGRAKAVDFAAMQSRFDQMVSSLVIP